MQCNGIRDYHLHHGWRSRITLRFIQATGRDPAESAALEHDGCYPARAQGLPTLALRNVLAQAANAKA
jgi:hypothetical protein